MEDLLEFLFGASGRINRAKYWKSLIILSIAGLLAAVILGAAFQIATPLFALASVLVLLPWIIWGFAIHTERLHDRDKSAWWLVVFYIIPGVIAHFAKAIWFAGTAGAVLQSVLLFAAFALTMWGFVEFGFLRGTAGPNRYGANPLAVNPRR